MLTVVLTLEGVFVAFVRAATTLPATTAQVRAQDQVAGLLAKNLGNEDCKFGVILQSTNY